MNFIAFVTIQTSGQPSSSEVDEDLAERMSAMRRPGETDMDYFERRYQERVLDSLYLVHVKHVMASIFMCYSNFVHIYMTAPRQKGPYDNFFRISLCR